MLTVKSVSADGVGAELGIEVGDRLVSFDGTPFSDLIDYVYCDSLTETTLTVESNGVSYECEVEKDADETFGLTFAEQLPTARCRNKCVFCFVDQLPKGMRRSLYVKDDDWRWSLISGNYVTLTNLSEADFGRILRYRISPLYVSVHAIDPAVRARLLGNPDADILPRLRAFRDAGIKVHAQIVLVPTFNDGAELERTLDALRSLAASVAIVPVGLTCHRKTPLPPVTRDVARAVIATAEAFSASPNADGKLHWAIPSDEFYLRAELPLPSYETYGAFDQIEDGVGLVAKLDREFAEALAAHPPVRTARAVDVATGWDAYPLLRRLCTAAESAFDGLRVAVHRIRNDFFGPSITVSGLVVGRDLVAQLTGTLISDTLLIPHVMIREGGDVFLDDMTVDHVSKALGARVVPVRTDGASLLAALLGERAEE